MVRLDLDQQGDRAGSDRASVRRERRRGRKHRDSDDEASLKLGRLEFSNYTGEEVRE